jgi:nitrogen-specific signal transduction histidine kinase
MTYTGQEREAPWLVNVARTVEEMAEILKLSISKRVSLHTDLDKNLPSLRASGAQIRQIVMNLVMNASEAIGDQDGMIGLTVRRVKVGHDRLAWIPIPARSSSSRSIPWVRSTFTRWIGLTTATFP